MPRFPSVDLVRGAAIALMVLVHFVDNLSPRDDSSSKLYDACYYLGALPAPLFAFVSGFSFSLWVRAQRAEGRSERAITRTALRRGAFLFAAGLLFNFCIWLPEETFNWDILTLLGASLILLAFARHLEPPVLTVIAVLIVLLSPALRAVGDFPAYWEDDAFTYDHTPRDLIFGFVANGYFPLFPWLLFPLAGYIAGELDPGRIRAKWKMPAVGAGLIAIAAGAIAWDKVAPGLLARAYADGYTEFPASTPYLLGMLGFCLLSLGCSRSWFDGREPGFAVRHLHRFSRFSLTIYVVHHAAHLWPLWLYGALKNSSDVTAFWRNAINTSLAVGLAVAFLILTAIALRWSDRWKKYSLESLMRRLCG